jgi:hypothetical protein
MTQDAYTGVQGVVSYAGAPIAIAECDITITRGVAVHPRSGKWSDYKLPGKADVTGTLKRIQVDGLWLAALLNATPTTGTATLLEAAAIFTAGTAYPINDAVVVTPSRIRITLSVDSITTGGTATIYGTDANDVAISEVIVIANGSAAGTTWTSTKVFKTCTYWLPVGIASTGGGKFAFNSIAGDATVDLGEPKTWDFAGSVVDGTNNIYVNMLDCFFTSGKFHFSDANAMLSDEMAFTMKDPDAGLTVTYVNA